VEKKKAGIRQPLLILRLRGLESFALFFLNALEFSALYGELPLPRNGLNGWRRERNWDPTFSR
jgi:hypothetical protein